LLKSIVDGKSGFYFDWRKEKEIESDEGKFSLGKFFLFQLDVSKAQKFHEGERESYNYPILLNGIKLIEENRFSEAISEIETFITLSGSFPYLELILSRTYLNIGATKNALRILLSLTNRDAGFSSAFEVLGDAHKKDGNLAESARFYQLSLKINPYGKAQEKMRKIQEELRAKDSQKDEDSSVLEECLVDLTSSIGEQYFPIIGRDSEIEQIMEILLCKSKNNILILGDSGVGKSSLVYGLAQKIKSGDVPERLKGKRIIQIYFSPLIAGAKLRGQFEERVMKLLKRIKEEDCISFIDDIHTGIL
jgi:ATPases with chaperone activity, ATP-binding subunit